MLLRLLPLFLAAVVVAFCFNASPRPANAAQSVREILYTTCPNGVQVRAAENAVDEALALSTSNKHAAEAEAAKLYYECAHSAVGNYVRQWALLGYSGHLFGSIDFSDPSDPNVASKCINIKSTLRDLMMYSRYKDVRQFAGTSYQLFGKVCSGQGH
jgi:hypothetical protein